MFPIADVFLSKAPSDASHATLKVSRGPPKHTKPPLGLFRNVQGDRF